VRNADLVKIACLAQLVNVIGALMTRPEGVLRQPIYWPFVLFSEHARGVSLVPRLEAPTYEAGARGEAPVLDAAASYDQDASTLSVFLINRQTSGPLDVRLHVCGSAPALRSASALGGLPPDATNTWSDPDRVRPFPAVVRTDGTTPVLSIPAPGLAVATFFIPA
jgi:alpha-N-arabinofuranosidase